MTTQQDDITSRVKEVMHLLKIPSKLEEDCIQEGWLAFCQKDDIFNHLRQWYNQELTYKNKHKLFGNLDTSDREGYLKDLRKY